MRNHALLLPALLAAGCTLSDHADTATAAEALAAGQCDHFEEAGKVTICHATADGQHAMLRVSEQACVHAHAEHAGDFVAVDGDCGPGACLPAAAPCDATLPCCDGLTCTGGACTDIDECAIDDGGCPAAMPISFQVWPRATWLEAGAPAVTPIQLAAYWLEPGDTVRLQMRGDHDYVGIPGEGMMLAAFSADGTIAGALEAAPPYDTAPIAGTDVSHDFLIAYQLHRGDEAANFNGIDVVVPAGATHLLVGLLDDSYADNPDFDRNLGFIVQRLPGCVNTPGGYECVTRGL